MLLVCMHVCSFIRAFAGAFDGLDIPAEKDRSDKARRRTPPRKVAEGVPPSGPLTLAPAAGPSSVAEVGDAAGPAVALLAGELDSVDGSSGAVVSEVGAGTALLAQLAATKKGGSDLPPCRPTQQSDGNEDPMTWLTKPRPTTGVPLPGLTHASFSTQDDDGSDALNFFVAAASTGQ